MNRTARIVTIVGASAALGIAALIVFRTSGGDAPARRMSTALLLRGEEDSIPAATRIAGGTIERDGQVALPWSLVETAGGRGCTRLLVADYATSCSSWDLAPDSSGWEAGAGPNGSWFLYGRTTTDPAKVRLYFGDGRERDITSGFRWDSTGAVAFAAVVVDPGELVGFEMFDAENRRVLSAGVVDYEHPPKL